MQKINPEIFFDWGKQKTQSNGKTDAIKKKRKDILRFRSWQNDVDQIRRLEQLVEDICHLDPKEGEKAKQDLANGAIIDKLSKEAFSAGTKGNETDFPAKLLDRAQNAGATEKEIEHLKEQFQKGIAKKNEFINQRPVKFVPPPFKANDPLPYRLNNLNPSRSWKIMVDETGNIFDQTIFDAGISKKDKGKFVAVAIPEDNDLPRIDYFHATDSYTAAIAETLHTLLHAKKPCGIIGVTLDSMLNLPMNYWYNGLERLFDLILRQLPMDDQPVRLDFMIEGRGIATDQMVQRAADACLYRFAKAYPQKAAKITVRARTFAKKTTKNKDFLSYNGYVDSLACAWNGKRHELKKILRDYRLPNICLLEGEVQNLYEVMDNAEQGIPMPASVWDSLIVSPDAQNADSIISAILDRLGKQVQKDMKLWKVYLNTTLTHLNSKAIDIRLLGRQISWLKDHIPNKVVLPPRLKLTWLTAELAYKNHTGATEMKYEQEFLELIEKLYQEDAPLTCWAVLNFAVQKTNAYKFKEARDLLEKYNRFSALLSPEPPFTKFLHSLIDKFSGSKSQKDDPFTAAAIPGLRYYGQLLSSCGQHEAFLGDNLKAIIYFQEAIRCFEQLSENREDEISHTMAYYATSQMDLDPDSATTRAILEQYLRFPLEKAAVHYAISDSNEEKYHHHILLRYLVQQNSDSAAVKKYLEQAPAWKTGKGHPWELIEFYRGMLFSDPRKRMEHWKQAHNLSQGFDATLHIIDAVILGSILTEDPSVRSEYEKLVERCAQEVPALGERITILREQSKNPLPPLELAEKILPFNFR